MQAPFAEHGEVAAHFAMLGTRAERKAPRLMRDGSETDQEFDSVAPAARK